LQGKGAKLEEREYGKSPLTESELRAIIGDATITDFLNPRSPLYRERRIKEKPPSKEEAIQLILKDQNLLKRPVTVKGKRKIFWYDEPGFKEIL
jgi:arsenate reductase-like glutaredoxin family protein